VSNPPRLPSVTSDIPRDLRMFLDRVRETLSTGVISADEVREIARVTPSPFAPADPATQPPIPTGVRTLGEPGAILVEWDPPGYGGHLYTEIWAGTLNDIRGATAVGMAPGASFPHLVGSEQERYYWVRFVNVSGLAGRFHAQSGIYGKSLPSFILPDPPTDALDASELNRLLDERLRWLEDPETGLPSTTSSYSNLNAQINEDGGIVSQVEGLQVAVEPSNLFAGLQTQGIVWADATGEGTAGATYTLKLRAQDNTGAAQVGFGMAAVKENGQWVADVQFNANRFSIRDPSAPIGSPRRYPFIVANGVTYIDTAMIPNLGVTNAKIANLSADKLTAGAIAVGQSIRSTNFVNGVSGWTINGDGNAQFGSVSIRGQLTAGQITDLSIDPSKIRNDSTFSLAGGFLGSGTTLDIPIWGGNGGEDRARLYAILFSIDVAKQQYDEGNPLYLAAKTIRIQMRLETTGSNFYDRSFTIAPIEGMRGVVGGSIATRAFPNTFITDMPAYNVDATWGAWGGSGLRTFRMIVNHTSGAGALSGRFIVIGYKK
jgi:hypothetical protein